jgi:alpha/beta superfamily hydrolase
MSNEHAVTIENGGLRLEGAIRPAARDGDGALAAVVLHPHPQYGGDMSNHVVVAACEALAALGAATLRFNFRGTGRSEGAYDGGRGEAADARAAAAMLRTANPEAKFLLIGYSFGAMVAANVAGDVRPDALALISPPIGMVEMPAFDAALPLLIASGDRDQVAPVDAIRALDAPGRTIVVAPGVDHSWWPGLDQLTAAITAFVESALGVKAS